jgi:hypothetical protein
VGLTINYGPKPKVTAPEPLPKAPYAPKAYEAAFNVVGKGVIGKLYHEGVVPHANAKEFMLVTKSGLMVHSIAWPPDLFDEFQPFLKGVVKSAPTSPQLKTFLTGAMNEAFLKWAGFKAKTEAAAEPVSPGEAACKALNVQFATGNEPVVKLRNATKMYQLVGGSEGTSRYVVVAMTDDLKIAARHRNSMLSMRVEGPGLTKHKARLTNAGFSKFGPDYASVHLATSGDKLLAAKALGAVLLGLQLNLSTPWPDVTQCEKGI